MQLDFCLCKHYIEVYSIFNDTVNFPCYFGKCFTINCFVLFCDMICTKMISLNEYHEQGDFYHVFFPLWFSSQLKQICSAF